jgi:serine/threonine protein kinase
LNNLLMPLLLAPCVTPMQRPGQVPEDVVVKITDVVSASDIHTFQRVHTEITVLRHLDGVYGVIPLVEYGLSQGSQRSSGSGTGRTSDAWHLVFPRYSSSLRTWRQQLQHLSLSNPAHVAGLLGVFQQVVDIVAAIHGQSVVHFDIKCDNVLISQGSAGVAPYRSRTTTAGALDLTGASSSLSAGSSSSDVQREKLQQACELLGVQAVTEVVLADFGDALWFPAGKPQTLRSRGTELFSSPEMLMLGTDRRASDSFDRRQGAGAGVPHDMWSLGCALFELLTGQVLFEREVSSVSWLTQNYNREPARMD